MEDGGNCLEDHLKELTIEQHSAVIMQVAISLAIVEKELLFEHRDL